MLRTTHIVSSFKEKGRIFKLVLIVEDTANHFASQIIGAERWYDTITNGSYSGANMNLTAQGIDILRERRNCNCMPGHCLCTEAPLHTPHRLASVIQRDEADQDVQGQVAEMADFYGLSGLYNWRRCQSADGRPSSCFWYHTGQSHLFLRIDWCSDESKACWRLIQVVDESAHRYPWRPEELKGHVVVDQC